MSLTGACAQGARRRRVAPWTHRLIAEGWRSQHVEVDQAHMDDTYANYSPLEIKGIDEERTGAPPLNSRRVDTSGCDVAVRLSRELTPVERDGPARDWGTVSYDGPNGVGRVTVSTDGLSLLAQRHDRLVDRDPAQPSSSSSDRRGERPRRRSCSTRTGPVGPPVCSSGAGERGHAEDRLVSSTNEPGLTSRRIVRLAPRGGRTARSASSGSDTAA